MTYPRACLIAVVMMALGFAFVSPAGAQAPAAPGVDVTDYARAFAYWQVPGLDPKACPNGPVAHYDEALIQSFTVPVTALTGEVQHVHAVAFVYGGLGSCDWYYGDTYLGLDRVHRAHVVTHELGHLVGHPDGLGVAGDPLGVMGGFAITPQMADLQTPEEVAAVASSTRPDPAAEAMLATRAREVVELAALAQRWDRYDTAVDRRDRARDRRVSCERKLRRAAKTPKGRRRAAARCRSAVKLPPVPSKPSLSRP